MSVTSKQVMGSRFRVTRLREGYDQSDVDAFMDKVAVTLAGYEGHPSPEEVLNDVPSPDVRPPTCPVDASPLAERSSEGLTFSVCASCGGVWLDRTGVVSLMTGADRRSAEPGGGTSSWIAAVFRNAETPAG